MDRPGATGRGSAVPRAGLRAVDPKRPALTLATRKTGSLPEAFQLQMPPDQPHEGKPACWVPRCSLVPGDTGDYRGPRRAFGTMATAEWGWMSEQAAKKGRPPRRARQRPARVGVGPAPTLEACSAEKTDMEVAAARLCRSSSGRLLRHRGEERQGRGEARKRGGHPRSGGKRWQTRRAAGRERAQA